MTSREITAWLAALTGLMTTGGSIALDSKKMDACEANYDELMSTYKDVVTHLIEHQHAP